MVYSITLQGIWWKRVWYNSGYMWKRDRIIPITCIFSLLWNTFELQFYQDFILTLYHKINRHWEHVGPCSSDLLKCKNVVKQWAVCLKNKQSLISKTQACKQMLKFVHIGSVTNKQMLKCVCIKQTFYAWPQTFACILQAPQEQLEHLLRICSPHRKIKNWHTKPLVILSKFLAADCRIPQN